MGEGLRVLNDCRDLFNQINYLITIDIKHHPEYKYTLHPQMLRSCISIGSNIAEGSRKTNKDFRRYIDIALGSAEELKFQLSLLSIVNPTIEKIMGQCVNLKKSLHP